MSPEAFALIIHHSSFIVSALRPAHRYRHHVRRTGAWRGLAQKRSQRFGLALAHAKLGETGQLQAGQIAEIDVRTGANAHLD